MKIIFEDEEPDEFSADALGFTFPLKVISSVISFQILKDILDTEV